MIQKFFCATFKDRYQHIFLDKLNNEHTYIVAESLFINHAKRFQKKKRVVEMTPPSVGNGDVGYRMKLIYFH